MTSMWRVVHCSRPMRHEESGAQHLQFIGSHSDEVQSQRVN